MTKETIEQEARRLRDAIYGKQTENNWEHCKVDWVKDIEWLRKNAPKKFEAEVRR